MPEAKASRKLLRVLQGEIPEVPPVWMMRQAGRYLPEYRELRSRTRDFLEFCYTPSIATEATLQPIRRYGFDASILFADILLILDAMDRNLRFVQGEGPVLDPIERASDLSTVPVPKQIDRLSPVFETVDRLRTALPDETTLIGFAGSPWTVAVYAIEGRGGTEKTGPRLWAHEKPEELDRVIQLISETTVEYLLGQAKAGADTLMLFDSWASGLPEHMFERYVIKPTRWITDTLKARGCDLPIIGFARQCGAMLKPYAEETGVAGVGLDTSVPAGYVNAALAPTIPVQGQLDPLSLIVGGDQLRRQTEAILEAYAGRPHIFNLGHGITPPTPPEHVSEMLDVIRNWKR